MNHLRHITGSTRTAHNPESRQITFTLSTSSRDRHGTVLNQDNWKLDNYLRNPVVGYQHNVSASGLFTDPNPDYIIGKAVNTAVINGVLESTIEFEPAEINELAEKIFRKVLFGSLNMSSVGFLELGKGKRVDDVYYFEGQELVEWSIVNIPSNPDAGAKRMLGEMPSACIYALKHLGSVLRPGQIERLPADQALLFIEARSIGLDISLPVSELKACADQSFRKTVLAAIKGKVSDEHLLHNAKIDLQRASYLDKMATSRPGLTITERETLMSKASRLQAKAFAVMNMLQHKVK